MFVKIININNGTTAISRQLYKQKSSVKQSCRKWRPQLFERYCFDVLSWRKCTFYVHCKTKIMILIRNYLRSRVTNYGFKTKVSWLSCVSCTQLCVSVKMDKKNAIRRAKRPSKVLEENYWDCSVCTYRNNAEAFKCSMCDVRKGKW